MRFKYLGMEYWQLRLLWVDSVEKGLVNIGEP